jgi:hypothetical protein
MPHRKGHTNNPNGRPIGTTNKTTANFRQWIGGFLDGQRSQVIRDWQKLEPKDRILMFEKLMRFVLPTLQSTTLQSDFEMLTDEQLNQIINELKRKA